MAFIHIQYSVPRYRYQLKTWDERFCHLQILCDIIIPSLSEYNQTYYSDLCRVRTILQLESNLQLVICAEKIFKQECYLMFIEAQVIHN